MTQEDIKALQNLMYTAGRLDSVAQEDKMCIPYKLAVAIIQLEQARMDCWELINSLTPSTVSQP